jgi:hypothetical protein
VRNTLAAEAAALVSAAGTILAANPNTDYITPPFTFSPDGRYGVMVPVWHDEGAQEPDERQNKVVELSTGLVVTVIHADPGYNRALNFHKTAPPHWSADSSVLLWKVNGKWFPDALVLLKLNGGNEQWQINLMKMSQRAILAHTREASPQRYAAARRANSGNGSAYPEGFTVDVKTDEDKIAFPFHVLVDLTANPKQFPGFPANLDSHLDAIVTSDGKFIVKDFHVIWPASQREITQRLIGEWEGAVHTRAFYAGGAFALDPQAAEKPNGTWELKGDQLITHSADEPSPIIERIVKITKTEMITTSDGEFYRYTRIVH